MAKAFILLLIIVAGFIVGPLLSGQSGYVLIAIAGYTLETSLVVLALSIVLVIFLLWLVEWLIRKISGGTRMSLRWSRRRRAKKARHLMNSALNNLLTDSYEAAQCDAKDAAHYAEDKEQAYLLAALAAEQHNDVVAKQNFLQKAAAEAAPDKQSLALQLHHAKRAAPATAVTNAKNLLRQYPEHVGVKRIAAEIFYQHQEWQPLLELLPVLDKNELANAERLHQYRIFVYDAYFAAASPNLEMLHRSWRELPKKERVRAVPRVSYASALQQAGHPEAAEKVILQGLRKNSLSASHLVHPSSTLNWQQHEALSEFIQGHIKQAPNDADALTLLGSVALHQGDENLAQGALRQAIQIKPSADRYRLLGDVYLASGQSQPALDAYREAARR